MKTRLLTLSLFTGVTSFTREIPMGIKPSEAKNHIGQEMREENIREIDL